MTKANIRNLALALSSFIAACALFLYLDARAVRAIFTVHGIWTGMSVSDLEKGHQRSQKTAKESELRIYITNAQEAEVYIQSGAVAFVAGYALAVEDQRITRGDSPRVVHALLGRPLQLAETGGAAEARTFVEFYQIENFIGIALLRITVFYEDNAVAMIRVYDTRHTKDGSLL